MSAPPARLELAQAKPLLKVVLTEIAFEAEPDEEATSVMTPPTGAATVLMPRPLRFALMAARKLLASVPTVPEVAKSVVAAVGKPPLRWVTLPVQPKPPDEPTVTRLPEFPVEFAVTVIPAPLPLTRFIRYQAGRRSPTAR